MHGIIETCFSVIVKFNCRERARERSESSHTGQLLILFFLNINGDIDTSGQIQLL